LTATLSNLLTDFNNFYTADTGKKMYKTGRAFNYLLRKESVANDVIIVCVRRNYVKNVKC